MQFSSLPISRVDFIRPDRVLSGKAKAVLQDGTEQLLTADSNLSIDARHTARCFMGSVHQRIIKTKPTVERIVLIKTLKFFQRQTTAFATLAEFRFVLSGYSDGFKHNLYVFSVIVRQGQLLSPCPTFLN